MSSLQTLWKEVKKSSEFSRAPESGKVKEGGDMFPSIKIKDRNATKNWNQFDQYLEDQYPKIFTCHHISESMLIHATD